LKTVFTTYIYICVYACMYVCTHVRFIMVRVLCSRVRQLYSGNVKNCRVWFCANRGFGLCAITRKILPKNGVPGRRIVLLKTWAPFDGNVRDVPAANWRKYLRDFFLRAFQRRNSTTAVSKPVLFFYSEKTTPAPPLLLSFSYTNTQTFPAVHARLKVSSAEEL